MWYIKCDLNLKYYAFTNSFLCGDGIYPKIIVFIVHLKFTDIEKIHKIDYC